jgi:hypothetical protein
LGRCRLPSGAADSRSADPNHGRAGTGGHRVHTELRLLLLFTHAVRHSIGAQPCSCERAQRRPSHLQCLRPCLWCCRCASQHDWCGHEARSGWVPYTFRTYFANYKAAHTSLWSCLAVDCDFTRSTTIDSLVLCQACMYVVFTLTRCLAAGWKMGRRHGHSRPHAPRSRVPHRIELFSPREREEIFTIIIHGWIDNV